MSNLPPVNTALLSYLGLRRSGRQTFASYTVIDDNTYTFPARIRSSEPSRKVLIVKNLGTTSAQLGYGANTNNNNNYNGPSSWAYTLLPGQEFVEASGVSNSLFFRSAVNGQSTRLGVYVELGVQ